jgi:DNA-binding NtrC family response regulator
MNTGYVRDLDIESGPSIKDRNMKRIDSDAGSSESNSAVTDHRTLLVVDDESSIRRLLCNYLTKQGFTTFEAEDATTALSVLSNHPVDLVLSDLRMPGMDGMELFRQIRDLYPNTDVILLTGYPEINDAIEALKSGALDFLLKPIQLDRLTMVINQAIETRRLRREVSRRVEEFQRFTIHRDEELNSLKTKVDTAYEEILQLQR